MKRMAVLDENNVVINIIECFDHEWDKANQITYTQENPAHIGGDYVDGYFYDPQPFPSWTRLNGHWIPPKPKPESEGLWEWSEEDQEWQD